MSTAKELYDAAMLLKESCKKSFATGCSCILENGEKCPFYYVDNKLGLCCLSEDREPVRWNVKKPRIFTDEEVALAKTLKSFGATTAKRTTHDVCFFDAYQNCFVAISLDFFRGLGERTTSIDEIIKDGEEE